MGTPRQPAASLGVVRTLCQRIRLLRSLSIACALLLVDACAFDTVGMMASRVTSAEGAWVVDIYSAGAYLHPRADDPGLQFGVGRRSYVFDKRDERELTPGWHYFVAPLPQRSSYARDSRSYGLDATFARNDLGFTLGLRATTVMARLGVDDSAFYRLHYEPERPVETRLEVLRISGGDIACLTCQWSGAGEAAD
jgi:hypothetical protein